MMMVMMVMMVILVMEVIINGSDHGNGDHDGGCTDDSVGVGNGDGGNDNVTVDGLLLMVILPYVYNNKNLLFNLGECLFKKTKTVCISKVLVCF